MFVGASARLDGARWIVGHPADLKFGDCFAYACAKLLGARLIHKGKDFAHTDIA